MKFRLATIEDAEVVTAIYNEHIAIGISTMDRELKPVGVIESWFREFNSRELIVLLEIDNKVAGWGIIKRYSDREGYARACETAIYLNSNQTGKGYGSEMKRWIISKCKDLGYNHLVAKIFSSNTGSINYNLKLGYTIVGTQNRIGYVDGEWQDVTILQLLI